MPKKISTISNKAKSFNKKRESCCKKRLNTKMVKKIKSVFINQQKTMKDKKEFINGFDFGFMNKCRKLFTRKSRCMGSLPYNTK